MAEHEDDNGAGSYSGPATITIDGHTPARVQVELTGHFDPLAGRYVWAGRIRGLAQILPADVVVAAGTRASITTPQGSGDGELSAVDLFGGFTIAGVTAPPFAQLPDDVDRDDVHVAGPASQEGHA
jgi:outer membrane protein assembly factor BamB